MNATFDATVTTDWLADNISAPDLTVVDASFYLPAQNRDANAEYVTAHIPGAHRFDFDVIADASSSLPHMLPSEDVFAAAVGAMGIGNASRVVVYEGSGLQSAARVWWMFRAMGHNRVAVLEGGLPKWTAEGGAVTSDPPAATPTTFNAALRPEFVRSLNDVRANVGSGRSLVLDARSRGRFDGSEPEARKGLRSGHIPDSSCMPSTDLVDPETKSLRDPETLRALLAEAGVRDGQPVITTCGSGVAACTLGLALHLTGRDDWAVYDGSWTEWGGRTDTPVET
jgi:thiosulfate/3-mercaptopyruvate sulfurtransferase